MQLCKRLLWIDRVQELTICETRKCKFLIINLYEKLINFQLNFGTRFVHYTVFFLKFCNASFVGKRIRILVCKKQVRQTILQRKPQKSNNGKNKQKKELKKRV